MADYQSDEEAAPGSPDSGMPELQSDDDSSEDEAAQARPLLPHASVLLLAAVSLAELTRRFLAQLGTTAAGAGAHAAAWAAADRLRQLTEVPTAPGAARDAVVVSCCSLGCGALLLSPGRQRPCPQLAQPSRSSSPVRSATTPNPACPAPDPPQADIRTLLSHLSRLFGLAAELMRGLQYLGSGGQRCLLPLFAAV